jgi:hypothetical protein
MTRCLLAIVVSLFVLVLIPRGLRAEDAVSVHVPNNSATTLTADQIKTRFANQVKEITYASHGQPHKAHAVSLLAVLQASGLNTEIKMDPNANPRTKMPFLHDAVVVTGRDGYGVAFSVPELLPDIGATDAWLSIDADGAALSAAQAPVQLIVPDDKKPGRWVRGVADISVIDCKSSTATTQPTP